MQPEENTLAIVFALGEGRELLPLTAQRTKAAVPFGGNYRIIDFPLANCLRSGLRRILVLTQQRSHSLHKHLRDGWSIFNAELGEFVIAVPPQELKAEGYTGTADALKQNAFLIRRSPCEYVCVLCGEHVYRMDYGAMLGFHIAQGADATLACREADDVAAGQTRLALDSEHRVRAVHQPCQPGGEGEICASIEVAIFSKALLLELLDQGRALVGHGLVYDLLEDKTSRYRVLAYGFGGRTGRVTQDRYWRSLESLDAYYQANMDLLQPFSPMDLYQSDWPIRTYHAQHPPARTVPGKSSNEGVFVNSIAGSGTVIAGGGVNHSVLFPSVFVDDAATVEDSILFSGVRVGEGAQLRHWLNDKEGRTPAGVRIGYDRELDAKRFTVTEQGIIVVPKAYAFGYP